MILKKKEYVPKYNRFLFVYDSHKICIFLSYIILAIFISVSLIIVGSFKMDKSIEKYSSQSFNADSLKRENYIFNGDSGDSEDKMLFAGVKVFNYSEKSGLSYGNPCVATPVDKTTMIVSKRCSLQKGQTGIITDTFNGRMHGEYTGLLIKDLFSGVDAIFMASSEYDASVSGYSTPPRGYSLDMYNSTDFSSLTINRGSVDVIMGDDIDESTVKINSTLSFNDIGSPIFSSDGYLVGLYDVIVNSDGDVTQVLKKIDNRILKG